MLTSNQIQTIKENPKQIFYAKEQKQITIL